MAPALITPLVSASISSAVGAVAFMITNLSKQRTERVKHRETIDLDRERLRLVMKAYQRDVVGAQAPNLADLTRALLGSNEPVDYGCDSKFTGTTAPRDAIPPPHSCRPLIPCSQPGAGIGRIRQKSAGTQS
jgi:hypothetical protein